MASDNTFSLASFLKRPENEDRFPVVELLVNDNVILNDIKWLEGNENNGHTTTIRTGLPKPTWRRLYEGVQPTKSKVSKVTDTCGMLEARSEIDADLVKMSGGKDTFLMNEARAHTEGMNEEYLKTLFYGDTKVNPHHFMGLAPRYAFSDAPNVIDAGGTGSNCTSVWAVVWGEDAVHGIFPKGSTTGVMHEGLGEYDAFDGSNNRFRVKGDLFQWKAGLCVRDWRCVVRIANIDTTNIDAVNLQKLTIEAKNRIPQSKRSRLVWYANDTVLSALEVAAMDSLNTHLKYGEYLGSSDILKMHGAPVRSVDAISTSEEALTTLS